MVGAQESISIWMANMTGINKYDQRSNYWQTDIVKLPGYDLTPSKHTQSIQNGASK
jgi:hypothetical protein